MTIWIDASSGASGDMLLGALLGAGVPVEVLQAAVDAIAPEPVGLRVERVTRHGFAATRCHVEVADSVDHRTWRDIRDLLAAADLADPVRELATRTFERLAVAEATVHDSDPLDVHFHEVGALDAIADVVGVCAGFVHLRSWSARSRSAPAPSGGHTGRCRSPRRRSPSCSGVSRRTPARPAHPPSSSARRPGRPCSPRSPPRGDPSRR